MKGMKEQMSKSLSEYGLTKPSNGAGDGSQVKIFVHVESFSFDKLHRPNPGNHLLEKNYEKNMK